MEEPMGDILDRVVSQQDVFKKILSKLPGFKGYFERADRRAADKLLREQIADHYQAQWTRLSGIQRDMVNAGKIELLDDIEIASVKLRTFIDKVKTAAYGYAGFFDAVKVKEEELTQVYQYDLTLLTLLDSVTAAIDNMEASLDTDGMPAAIRNLIQKAQESLDAFNKRSELMKLGQ
jgi:DNA-directed RNA polymerase beta' subunit